MSYNLRSDRPNWVLFSRLSTPRPSLRPRAGAAHRMSPREIPGERRVADPPRPDQCPGPPLVRRILIERPRGPVKSSRWLRALLADDGVVEASRRRPGWMGLVMRFEETPMRWPTGLAGTLRVSLHPQGARLQATARWAALHRSRSTRIGGRAPYVHRRTEWPIRHPLLRRLIRPAAHTRAIDHTTAQRTNPRRPVGDRNFPALPCGHPRRGTAIERANRHRQPVP